MKKLAAKELFKECSTQGFSFESTQELEPLEDMIGQDRAVQAMDFGLKVKHKGYNIYMAGVTGTGKTSYAKSLIKKIAKEGKTPDDWCYVYNFSEPDRPKTINFPAGSGKDFVKDIDNLINEFRKEIPKALDSEDFESKKRDIWEDYQKQSSAMLQEFEKWARERDVTIQKTEKGFFLVPIVDGEPIDQKKMQSLSEEKAKEIHDKLPEMQKELDKAMRKLRNLEKKTFEKIKELEKELILSIIQSDIENLKYKYSISKVSEYLENIKEDIIINLDNFKKKDESDNPFAALMLSADRQDSLLTRYKVNLFVNNSDEDGAPLIIETNPTYYNLFGKIEGKPQFGTISTDFTNIKNGSIHKANGGYLIVNIIDILKNFDSWDALKRILLNQKAYIENIGEQFRIIPTTTIKPEPIPINIKVILIGSTQIQQLLFKYDEDFRKLFKVKAHFDIEMKRDSANITKYASFVASMCEREELNHFDASGVARVVEFSSRLAENQKKLSTRFNEVAEIIFESSAWAELEQSENVTEKHVEKAIREKDYRSNLIEEKIQEMIDSGDLLVDTVGKTVGQINGISVYHLGDYSFGRPSRITARVYLGKPGVVNIEKEVKMSGSIHSKGVLILSGYLGGKYAKEIQLSLTASLCFEQNYCEVEGDSASCAELIAILSSIVDIPLKQGIAITGSINQMGEIQPIGGVNEKIEGYYTVCKQKGFNGEQGIIIPHQNVKNLMLKEEVIDAVDKGEFNIYSIKNVDGALEILTGYSAEEMHQKITETLQNIAQKSKRLNNE